MDNTFINFRFGLCYNQLIVNAIGSNWPSLPLFWSFQWKGYPPPSPSRQKKAFKLNTWCAILHRPKIQVSVGQRLWLERSCLMISPATKQTSRYKTRPLSACLFWQFQLNVLKKGEDRYWNIYTKVYLTCNLSTCSI